MKHRLYYVTGFKGGIGKSLLCSVLVRWLLENNQNVRVIDTDKPPDVGKSYEAYIPVEYLPLTEDAGSWEEFMNKLQDLSNDVGDLTQLHVVVNGAAGEGQAIQQHGDFFNSLIGEGYLNYDLSTFWVLSDYPDSVELFESYLSAIHVGSVFLLRNIFFAADEKNLNNPRNFKQFTQALPEFKSRIDKILNFPKLDKTIADRIKAEKISLMVAEQLFLSQHLGTFYGYKRWLVATYSMFNDMNSFWTQKEAISEGSVVETSAIDEAKDESKDETIPASVQNGDKK